MSRSGYSDSCDGWDLVRWRGAVASAVRGRRGQAFLRELLAELDALPGGKLIAGDLESGGGVCALGAVLRARGIAAAGVDPEDREAVAGKLGLAPALAAEVSYVNDECGRATETPEERCARVREWVAGSIRDPAASSRRRRFPRGTKTETRPVTRKRVV